MKRWLSGLICLMLVVINLPTLAVDPFTVPTGQNVVAGNVYFSGGSGVLNVYSQSTNAIVNYQSFSVGSNARVHFDLPHSSAAILNRVVGGSISEIFGNLTSDGRVFLVNPNGIHFGAGSFVSVNSLFASTLNISNNDFLNGNYVFYRTSGPASIVNAGQIQTANYAGFFTNAFKNDNLIIGKKTLIGIGDQINLNLGSGAFASITISKELKKKVAGFNSAIENNGSIVSDIEINTLIERDIYDSIVNNTGLINATRLDQRNGSIELITETIEDDGSRNLAGEVVNDGTVKSQSNILLTEELINTGTLTTVDDLGIQANLSVENSGIINGNGTLYVETQDLENSGTIDSGYGYLITKSINNSGDIKSDSDLIGQATNSFANSGNIETTNDFFLETNSFGNQTGGNINTNNLYLLSNTFSNNGSISTSNDLGIQSTSSLYNNGNISASNEMFIETDELTNNTNGDIQTRNGLIKASSLKNTGSIYASEDLNILLNGSRTETISLANQYSTHSGIAPPTPSTSTENLTYSLYNKEGSISAGSNLNIDATNEIRNRSADLIAGNDLTIIGPKLINEQDGLYTSYSFEVIDIGGTPHNFEYWTDQTSSKPRALLGSGNNLNLFVSNIENRNSDVIAGNDLSISGSNLLNTTNIRQQTTHETWVRQQAIGGDDTRHVWTKTGLPTDLASIDVSGNTLIGVTGTFENSGSVISAGDLNLQAQTFINGINDPRIQTNYALYDSAWLIPGYIGALNMNIQVGNFLNTGMIKAENELLIKAQSIENRRRTALAYANVKTYGGLFGGGSKFEQIEYDQLQPGGIIEGGNILITAENDFLNKGGIVSAENLLKIDAENIFNEVQEGQKVVAWDPGRLGKLVGLKNWDYASDYSPGQLRGNEIVLGTLNEDGTTRTNVVKNIGSDIIADTKVEINANNLVEQNWVASHHVSSDTLDFSGFSIERNQQTEHVTRSSTIEATNGDVIINAGNRFRNIASDVFADGDISVNANEIEISDGIHQSVNQHDSLSLNFSAPSVASLDYQETDYTVTTHRGSNFVAGNNINLSTVPEAITDENGEITNLEELVPQGDINITGSSLLAGNQINLDAQNISIVAGEYTDTSSTVGGSVFAGLGPGTVTVGASGYVSEGSVERVTPSTLSAESINVNTSNSTNIDASILSASDSIDISAPNLTIGGEYAYSNSETVFGGANATFSPSGFVGAGVNGGMASESSGIYHLSYISAPNLTIDSANQNIDGANINGREINPSGNQSFSTGTESFNFGIGVSPNSVSLSAGFNDFQFSGGGGPNSGFISLGYDQYSIGTGLTQGQNPGSEQEINRIGLFGSAFGVGAGLGITPLGDHPALIDGSISYGPFAFNGSMQGGQLISLGGVAGFSEFDHQFAPEHWTCFVAGTPITMADGSFKNIENIKTGDKVLSWNEETKKNEAKTVLNSFKKHTNQIVEIKLVDKLIETTSDHPFYVPNQGWVEAGKLNINDKLFDESGNLISIGSLSLVDRSVPVYNFEVEDNHTYYAHGILVHNNDACIMNGRLDVGNQELEIVNGQHVYDQNGHELSPVEIIQVLNNSDLSADQQASLLGTFSINDKLEALQYFYNETINLNLPPTNRSARNMALLWSDLALDQNEYQTLSNGQRDLLRNIYENGIVRSGTDSTSPLLLSAAIVDGVELVVGVGGAVTYVIRNPDAVANAFRTVGNLFTRNGIHQITNVLDVMRNPRLLEGKSLSEVQTALKDTINWENTVMTQSTRHPNGGWVLREVNSRGLPTGKRIQYHPGTPRHFNSQPYWKISDGANVFRFIAK